MVADKLSRQALERWCGQGLKLTLPRWNEIFVQAEIEFKRSENEHRTLQGWNHITSGWHRTGLITGDIVNAPAWRHAIETLGTASKPQGQASAQAPAPAEGQPTEVQQPAAPPARAESSHEKWYPRFHEIVQVSRTLIESSANGATLSLVKTRKKPEGLSAPADHELCEGARILLARLEAHPVRNLFVSIFTVASTSLSCVSFVFDVGPEVFCHQA